MSELGPFFFLAKSARMLTFIFVRSIRVAADVDSLNVQGKRRESVEKDAWYRSSEENDSVSSTETKIDQAEEEDLLSLTSQTPSAMLLLCPGGSSFTIALSPGSL